VVTVGLTLISVPLVAARLPGVITPVPFAKTAVRSELAPAAIVVGFATKLAIVGAGTTVTVTVRVIAVPTGGVTVRVYVVVVAGLTLTPVPLVTARLPGVIIPVPLAKTAVRVELPPKVIVAGFATKLLIVGAGTTVSVAIWIIAVPAELVTVRVYVVVVAGFTVTPVPLVATKLPGVIRPVPLAKTAVRLEPLPPAAIVAGLAPKLLIVGAGTTVTVAICVMAAPTGGVTVRV